MVIINALIKLMSSGNNLFQQDADHRQANDKEKDKQHFKYQVISPGDISIEHMKLYVANGNNVHPTNRKGSAPVYDMVEYSETAG